MILKGAPLRNFVTVFSVFFRSPNFSFDIYQYKRHGHRCNLPWEFQHILLILVIHKRIKPKCPSLRYAIECIICEIYAFLSDKLTWRHLVHCIAQKKVIGAFPGHTTAVTFTTQRPPEPTNHWPHPDRSRNAIDVLMMQAYYILFTTRRPDAMAILTVKYGPIFISSRASMCNLKLTIEKKTTLRKD